MRFKEVTNKIAAARLSLVESDFNLSPDFAFRGYSVFRPDRKAFIFDCDNHFSYTKIAYTPYPDDAFCTPLYSDIVNVFNRCSRDDYTLEIVYLFESDSHILVLEFNNLNASGFIKGEQI